MKKIKLTTGGVLIYCNFLWATNYFIDSGQGNDTCNGLSLETAWQTFYFLNAEEQINPGDSVFLVAGSVWNSGLINDRGGEEGKPVYIGAYGEGDPPTIDLMNTGHMGVVSYVSYVVFEGLRVVNCTGSGMAFDIDGGCKGISILDCHVENVGSNGVVFTKGGEGIHLKGITVINAKNNGIFLGGSVENKLHDVIVEDCYISHVIDNDGIAIHESEGSTAGSGFIVRNNYAEYCAEQGFDITTGCNIKLISNRSYRNEEGGILLGHSADYVEILYHRSTEEPVKDMSAAVDIDIPNARLAYSIFEGNGYHLMLVRGDDTENIEIYNNIFNQDRETPPIDFNNSQGSVSFINNIILSSNGEMGRIRFLNAENPPFSGTFYLNNNLYYHPGDEIIFYNRSTDDNYNLTEFRNFFDQEAEGIENDPAFRNLQEKDYRLTINSPALESGLYIGIDTDFNGVMVPFHNFPDIGPFEYDEELPDDLIIQDSGQLKIMYMRSGFIQFRLIGDSLIKSFRMFSTSGQLVKNLREINSGSLIIEASDFRSGIYVCEVTGNERKYIEKVLINNR